MEQAGYIILFALLGAFILAVLLLWFFCPPSQDLQEFQAEHLATHAPLSDEEFLRQAGLPSKQGPIALQIRDAISPWGSPPATLHPSDTLDYICQFEFEMDGHELAGRIEEELKIHIPRKLRWNRNDWATSTVVDIIRRVINDCDEFSSLRERT